MTDKLKPCPFCGGEAYLANVMGRNGVCCKNIKCDVVLRGKLDATKEEVTEAWNTRKPMDRIVEQLDANYKQAHSDYKDTYNPYYEGQMLAYDIAEQIVKGGAE